MQVALILVCILFFNSSPVFQLLATHLATETEEEPNHEHDVEARVSENMRLKLERLDFRNDENKTPLHLAAMSGNVE